MAQPAILSSHDRSIADYS